MRKKNANTIKPLSPPRPPPTPEEEYRSGREILMGVLDYYIEQGEQERKETQTRIAEAHTSYTFLSAIADTDKRLRYVGAAELAEQLKRQVLNGGGLCAVLRREIDLHIADILGDYDTSPYPMGNAVKHTTLTGQGDLLKQFYKSLARLENIRQQHGFEDLPWVPRAEKKDSALLSETNLV
jgi:hypothetical protein